MKTLVKLLSTVAFVGACISPAFAFDGADASQTRADLGGLIGHNVEAAQDAKSVGKVDAILATRDGRISTVIVRNRNREVALAWNELRFIDGGNKVTVALTRDEVNALPDYRHQEIAWDNSSVLTTVPVAPSKKTEAEGATNTNAAPTAGLPSRTKTAASGSPHTAKPPSSTKAMASASSTAAKPAESQMADATIGPFVGHGVEDTAGERIGEIDNVAIDNHGKVSSVIVGVGGFLGVGKHDVALNWDTLKISDNAEKVSVDMTKDQIKALPEVQSKDQTASFGKRMVIGSIN